MPPSWCGAPYRVQQWITQGWLRDLILASVREQVARKRGDKVRSVEYFDPVDIDRRDGSVIELVEKCRYCGGAGVEIIEVEPIDFYDLDEFAPPVGTRT